MNAVSAVLRALDIETGTAAESAALKVAIHTLRASYTEKSNDELESLSSKRAFLTPEACRALDLEMARRGMAPCERGSSPADAASLEPNLRNFRNLYAALFWSTMLTPLIPLLIVKGAGYALAFLFSNAILLHSVTAYIWSVRAVEVAALLVWVYLIKLGVNGVKKLMFPTHPIR